MTIMSESEHEQASMARPPINGQPARPIGAWVVAGLVMLATLTMWTVVSIVFYAYS
jgi:hypothetical protein